MTRVWILVCLLGGCFVNSTDSDTALVTFSVGVPAASTTYAQKAPGYWDSLGLFYIGQFPKYVRVAVEHPDGYELAKGTWPDPQLGVGATGEGAQGEVDVSLEVPVGNGRRLRVLGFVEELGQVLVFAEDRPLTLDLAPGQTMDLDVDTIRVDTGRVDLTVRCQYGNLSSWVPDRVFLVDVRAGVVFPPQKLIKAPYTESLKAELTAVPTGRYFWPRIILKHSGTQQELPVEVRNPTFVVKVPNEKTAVSYVIPCQF